MYFQTEGGDFEEVPAMYERILVPLDGSKVAEQIVPHAEELARGMGAELIL